VVERGTGTRAALDDRPVAGKTGTSQAWRDAWFDGYIPQLATVVWVGNPVPVEDGYGNWAIESMTPSNGYGIKVVGGSYPARIWRGMMAPTTEDLAVRTFPEAPERLFGDPKKLKKIEGEETEIDVGDGLRGIIALKRSGRNVVVHTQCPPGGGSGIRTWKTEQRGDTTHVYRSRAVCR
jgi:membrane peptidoglycan carboxypeptidase